jgi:transposase
MKISRSAYTAEFKELAVKRVKAGESIATTAQELGMSDQTLRNCGECQGSCRLNQAAIC